MATYNKVDEDAKDVNDMVLAAKNGDWSVVFSIIDRKGYLINCIPEDYAWAALHRAVGSGTKDAVQKLLKYPSCDVLVKTKRDLEGHGAGRTPLWIAQNVLKPTNTDRDSIIGVLEDNLKHAREHRFGGEIDTYVLAQVGESMDRSGLPLLLRTLSSYKCTYHPKDVSPHEAFNQLLKVVYDNVAADTAHWKCAQDNISNSIEAFCKAAANALRVPRDEKNFFGRVVNIYTRNYVYREVNRALRREGQMQYKATAEDLALGPYILLLDVLLFYWGNLKPAKDKSGKPKVTYRGLARPCTQLKEKYAKGTKFVWLSFVSSSMNEEKIFIDYNTEGAIFEIDNTNPEAELWQPRDIIVHSEYDEDEEEALYPAGAEFLVTDLIQESPTRLRIKLQLMSPV